MRVDTCVPTHEHPDLLVHALLKAKSLFPVKCLRLRTAACISRPPSLRHVLLVEVACNLDAENAGIEHVFFVPFEVATDAYVFAFHGVC